MTPDGEGTVVETKPLLELVKVRLTAKPDAAPSVYKISLLKLIRTSENNDGQDDDTDG